jgi:hypothetical protein
MKNAHHSADNFPTARLAHKNESGAILRSGLGVFVSDHAMNNQPC